MSPATAPLRRLAVISRLAARALRRRATGQIERPPGHDFFSASLAHWLESLPHAAVRNHRFVRLPASQPPWSDSGVEIAAGDVVTVIADGHANLSGLLDLWVAPPFQLWLRIGERGPVFRGTRKTHTFTAARSGALWLANGFPGEWADETGRLRTDPREYAKISGSLSVLIACWRSESDAQAALAGAASDPQAPQWLRNDTEHRVNPGPKPDGWDYLWYLGPGEIFWPGRAADGRASICCHTHRDVGILRRDARLPLTPGTSLKWSWKVDELPVDVAEDTLPSHDYVSIAVEFDDGQDITYYWSAALPIGTVYRCPLPTWRDKETHVVVRTGSQGLGQWHNEQRDLFDDYRHHIGGSASAIVRVWLIANSLFQRGHGRCEYAGIVLSGSGKALKIT